MLFCIFSAISKMTKKKGMQTLHMFIASTLATYEVMGAFIWVTLRECRRYIHKRAGEILKNI